MMNHLIIVGRICGEVKIVKTENGKERGIIPIAVPRTFKNADGVYETDFFNCVCWGSIADNVHEYCKVGDVVGIKGRLQTKKTPAGEYNKIEVEIVAEKVTFLSQKKEEQ